MYEKLGQEGNVARITQLVELRKFSEISGIGLYLHRYVKYRDDRNYTTSVVSLFPDAMQRGAGNVP